MKVTVEDLSSVKKRMHIEIDQEQIVRELNDAYKTLGKTAKIKGFRPGKAPRSVLERMFKKDVHADVSSKLIQGAFLEALQETELKPVGTPSIDPPELNADGPYIFDADVEIAPDINDIDYSGLELKKTVYKVSDEEIDGQLKMIQKNMAERKPLEEPRPVADGDFVLIDYEGFKDGKPFAETQKTENFILNIGLGTIDKSFDDQLVGKNAGEELDVSVDFPEDHNNKALAGLKIDFKVSLKEIRTEKIPEIDDELAKKVGPYENLDALKAAIVDNLGQGYAKRTEQELNEQIFSALIDKSEFEVPDTMVDMELDGILQEAERAFTSRNMGFEDAGFTRDMLAEKYRETAEKQVRRHLILGKIIAQESLALSDEKMDKGFEDMAGVTGQPAEMIKDFYKENPERLEYFKHTLLEKEAIDLIIEKSQVEEVEPELETEAPAAPEAD